VPRVNFAIRETVALTTLSICSRAKTPRAARFCGYHWFSLTIAQTAHEGDRASIEDFVPTWNTPPKISRVQYENQISGISIDNRITGVASDVSMLLSKS